MFVLQDSYYNALPVAIRESVDVSNFKIALKLFIYKINNKNKYRMYIVRESCCGARHGQYSLGIQ